MPRTEQQNQIIKDRRRAKLIKAALRVFAIKGYEKTSVDDITKEARCSHGLFYHYFDAKDAAFEAVLAEAVVPSSVIPPVEEAARVGGKAGIQMLVEYTERIVNGDKHNCYAALVAMSLTHPEETEIANRIGLRLPNPSILCCDLIAQGQKDGDIIDGNPKEITFLYSAIVLTSIRQRINDDPNFVGLTSKVLMSMIGKEK